MTISTIAHSIEGIKSYTVRKVDHSPVQSGKGDDPAWENAEELSDFHYPWDPGKPHPTSFRALHDDEWLYCLFRVTDPSVHVHDHPDDKEGALNSSRAEIFFKANDKMSPYYCMEIDSRGRVLDYEAHFHRNFNRKWSWPAGHLIIKANGTPEGYTLEVAISKDSLRKLGLLNNGILQAGVFRGDCYISASGATDFKWISWAKPESETPDFHIPSSFGLLRLEH